MRETRKRRRLNAEINVVPYIDVMLVLLIIFMVTAPFVTQGVDVDLPQMSSAKPVSELIQEQESTSPVIVQIDKDGLFGIRTNNEDMQLTSEISDVITRVKAERLLNATVPILVGGDQNTPYFKVVSLLDELSLEGVESVGLLTDLKE